MKLTFYGERDLKAVINSVSDDSLSIEILYGDYIISNFHYNFVNNSDELILGLKESTDDTEEIQEFYCNINEIDSESWILTDTFLTIETKMGEVAIIQHIANDYNQEYGFVILLDGILVMSSLCSGGKRADRILNCLYLSDEESVIKEFKFM